MAEEKKTPGKQSWFSKLINWFVRLPGSIAKAFKNMVAELRKVTWPSKKKLISSCIIVLLFMLLVGLCVHLVDLGSAAAVNGLYNLGHPTAASDLVIDENEALIEETAETEETTEGEVTTETEATTEAE
ncbi:MAG: preprotein translocase subunit SecE [Clostridia bacterium]|nr:preprotein translocase subunit SecE [Clostridia bacterium]